jgi:hypothetical protein
MSAGRRTMPISSPKPSCEVVWRGKCYRNTRSIYLEAILQKTATLRNDSYNGNVQSTLTGIDDMLKVWLVMIFYDAEVVLDPVDIDMYALKKEHKITDRSAGQLSYFKRTASC